MAWERVRWSAIGVTSALLFGCAGGGMPCRIGADCPSGICLADGRCGGRDAGAPAVDARIDDGAMPLDDGAMPLDATLDASGPPIDGGSPGCGDGDEVITTAELPLPLGAVLPVRAARSVSVDTRGAERADGTRLWSLEGPFAGDADGAQVRSSLAGTWFESAFEGATYTLPLSLDDDLLGVFERTEGALLLRGVVSPTGGVTRTELTYEPPIAVWRFPLEAGVGWDDRTNVSGVANGVPTAYGERWQVSVDARGALGTPAGVRPVLRVSTLITRTVGLTVTPYRRIAFVEECVGTVGQVSGAAGVSSAELTFASELWRVAR